MSRTFDVVGIGLNATDTLLTLSEFPPYAGKVTFDQELISAGGQVTTALIACAKLGLRARYIGTVGDDFRGDLQRRSLAGTGVDTSGIIVRQNCPNQAAYILIDRRTGERTIVWKRSECLRLAPSELRPEDIASAKLLHLDAYDTEAAAEAAFLARQHGVAVSVDVDGVYAGFERVLRNVDYLVSSSGWPSEWTGEADPFAALTRIGNEYGMRVAGMTLGYGGALALADGEWTYSPAFAVECADTTGAGDVFHGAFCYAMLADMPIKRALEFSNAAAALNCTEVGARGHIPSMGEIELLLSRAEHGRIGRRAIAEIAERAAERRKAPAGSQ